MSDESSENISSEPLDPAKATLETFQPHVGSSFVMNIPEHPDVELSLIEAKDEFLEANAESEFRRPFSLVLEAGDETCFPQSTRQLNHPALGSFEVFVVPFGVVEGKTRYNVVFC